MQETTIYVQSRLSGGRLSTGAAPQEAPPEKVVPQEPEMTISPGGLIKQDIVRDTHKPEEWDAANTILFNVQLLNSTVFRDVTNMAPPESPVDAATYAQYGLPFYALYNEPEAAETGVDDLLTVAETDAAQGKKNDTVARVEFVRSPLIMLDPAGKKIAFRPLAHLEASAREILKERADAERKSAAAEQERLENDEPQCKRVRGAVVKTGETVSRRTKDLKILESHPEIQRLREIVKKQPNQLLPGLHSISVASPRLAVLIDEYTAEALEIIVFSTVYSDSASTMTSPETVPTGSHTDAAGGTEEKKEVDEEGDEVTVDEEADCDSWDKEL